MVSVKAVFETNILVDYLNGERKAATEISRYQKRLISRITWMEILVGAKTTDVRKAVFSFFQIFAVIEIDENISLAAVELRQQFGLKLPNAIILATARANQCLLVTRNTADFSPKKFPDVREPYRLKG